jgi:hypothetical protein
MRAAGPARRMPRLAARRRAPPRRRIYSIDNPKGPPVNLPRTPTGSASGWRPADPPRRPVLFVNPRSGGGKAARAGVAERARERGVEAVILDPGQDLAALARDAAAGGADALGAAGGGSLAVVAAVVLVSNNLYALDNPLAPGTRPALDTGRLGIVVLGVPGDASLRPGRAWTAPRLEVSAPAAVHAGVDGEAVDLSPPLRFAIRPTALRVRISSRHPGASPSAALHLPGPGTRRAAARINSE